MALWTDRPVARLKELWADHSCSQISGILAAEGLGNFSRNAVVGKAHRLGLEEKRHSYTEHSAFRYGAPAVAKSDIPVGSIASGVLIGIRRKRRPPNLKPERFNCDNPFGIEPRNVPLLSLVEGECRWPITDSLPHAFCGLKQRIGSSYCHHHHLRSVGEGTLSEKAAHKLPKMVA